MLDNRTDLSCEICSSHVYKYKQDGVLIIECSNCGTKISEYDGAIEIGDLYEEKDM